MSVPTDSISRMACIQCGSPAMQGSKYCSPQCREQRKYQRKKHDGRYAEQLARKRDLYQPRPPRPAVPIRTCSLDGCTRKHQALGMCKMHHRRWRRDAGLIHEVYVWDDKARSRYHARRARARGARNSDVVLLNDLVLRSTTCPECGQPIDLTLLWPDPMSRSIDHVMPLSKGGAHTLANTQLMHLRCNLSKGARLDPAAQPGSPLDPRGEAPEGAGACTSGAAPFFYAAKLRRSDGRLDHLEHGPN